MDFLLIFSFAAGQLIKLPISNLGGITLTDISLGIICLLGIFNIKSLPKKNPGYFKLGMSFGLIALLSLILSPLNLNLSEKIISFSYTIRFLIFLFSAAYVSKVIFESKKSIAKILLHSGIILALLGILQFIFFPDLNFLTSQGWDPHKYRLTSTFLDPNFVGAFFVWTLILILINPLKNTRSWQIIFFILTFIALMFTFSRGSYLMFGISFLIISVLKKSVKLFFLTIILGAILAAGFLFYQKIFAVPGGVDRAESANQRLDTWQQGWEIFTKNPVLGVGFNSYRFALGQYNLADDQQINSHGASTNDSSLLYVLATTGLVGLVIYLAFLVSILRLSWHNWQAKNVWGLIIISGLLGLTAQSFFANTLFYPPLLGWLMLSLSQLEDKSIK